MAIGMELSIITGYSCKAAYSGALQELSFQRDLGDEADGHAAVEMENLGAFTGDVQEEWDGFDVGKLWMLYAGETKQTVLDVLDNR